MTVRVFSDQAGTTAAAANDNIGKVEDLSKFDSDGVSSTTGPYLSVDANGFGSADILAQGGGVVQTFTNAIADGSALVVGTSKCIFFSNVNVEAGGTLTIGPAGDMINTNGLNLIGKVVSVATTTKVLTTAEQNSIATFFAERGASSVIVNDETVYDVNSVEADVVLDFTGDSFYRNVPHYFKLGGTYTTFADAFMGTSPKLTYSTAAGSNSTMVNSSGEIVWAPHNLLDYSSFGAGTGWSLQASTLTAVSAETTLAPDGTATAFELEHSATTAGAAKYTSKPSVDGVDYTVGLYAKHIDGQAQYLTIYADNAYVHYDLLNGVIANDGSTNQTADMVSVGGGWYYLTVTEPAVGTGFYFQFSLTSAPPSTAEVVGVTAYVWGAHVYRSDLGGMHPVPGAATGFEYYVPTNGSAEYLPRVGHHVYNGSTWVNEGLLIESEPRTNLIQYSHDFDQSYWTKIDCEVAAGVPSPLGMSTKVTRNSTSYGGLFVYNVIGHTVNASGEKYAFSVFVKNGDNVNTAFTLTLDTSGTGGYPLDTHSTDITFDSDGVASSSHANSTVTDYGNGWYRVSMFSTSTTSGSIQYGIVSAGTTDVPLNSYFYVGGAQLEAAPTPSSYMPTSGGTYTRTAQSLTVPPAQFGWNSNAVSIQMDGRMTYADEGLASQSTFVNWVLDGSNEIRAALQTFGSDVGQINYIQDESGYTQVEIPSAIDAYSPGVLVPFNLASRHGSTFVNGAVDGVALTEDTTPTALPDLSSTNLQIASDFMGTIGTFRQFAGDIGDAGLEEATKPSTEPTLSLTFDGTASGSFYNLSWSE